jgi:hypothetical protein
MEEVKYESEDVLQRLSAKFSNLLSGDQMDSEEPRRWLLVKREMGVPSDEDTSDRWSLDHLFLDQDGIPTLVEVKRSSNTDVRRKVVGQMLDYAANAVMNWPVEQLKEAFQTTCATEKRDPKEEVSKFLGPKGDFPEFWQRVGTNLKTGKVRMVIVADQIPIELRRIIEFLNKQMDPAEVLALEVRQYAGKDLKTLVPRLIGQTAGTVKGIAPSRTWTQERFFEAMEEQTGREEVEVVRELLRWAAKKGMHISWGKGKKYGSLYPVLEHNGEEYYPFGVITNGELYVGFNDIKTRPPFDSEKKRVELLAKLNSVSDKQLSKDCINRWVPMSLSSLKNPANLKKFKSTFDWLVREVKAC